MSFLLIPRLIFKLKFQHQIQIQLHFTKPKFKAQFMEDSRIVQRTKDVSNIKLSNDRENILV